MPNPVKTLVLFISCITIFSACHNSGQKVPAKNVVVDSLRKDSSIHDTSAEDSNGAKLDSAYISKLKPIFGYRFIITGDFKGNGKQDTLTEHFFDMLLNKESNKFYDSVSFDDQVGIVSMYKDPYSFLTCNDNTIDTLRIAHTSQLFGISYIKNEGDLNGDGTDEISYVIDYADYSSLNTCYIVTYKNGHWKELYSFDIRDWQLPDLPDEQTSYGLFGVDSMQTTSGDDTLNQHLEKELKAFPGLIIKLGKGKIKVHTYNEEADDVIKVVDLNKLPVKKKN